MEPRDQQIYEEATALWIEVFGDQPPAKIDAGAMLDIITRSLPVSEYERLRSQHLRASIIAGPGFTDHKS